MNKLFERYRGLYCCNDFFKFFGFFCFPPIFRFDTLLGKSEFQKVEWHNFLPLHRPLDQVGWLITQVQRFATIKISISIFSWVKSCTSSITSQNCIIFSPVYIVEWAWEILTGNESISSWSSLFCLLLRNLGIFSILDIKLSSNQTVLLMLPNHGRQRITFSLQLPYRRFGFWK